MLIHSFLIKEILYPTNDRRCSSGPAEKGRRVGPPPASPVQQVLHGALPEPTRRGACPQLGTCSLDRSIHLLAAVTFSLPHSMFSFYSHIPFLESQSGVTASTTLKDPTQCGPLVTPQHSRRASHAPSTGKASSRGHSASPRSMTYARL